MTTSRFWHQDRARLGRHPGARRFDRRRLAGGAAIGVYAWWVAGLAHFTLAALAAVAAAGVAVIAVAWLQHGARRTGSTGSAQLAPWAAVLGALAGWELLAYSLSPRSAHPTLSSMADAALRPRLLEAVAFAAWLGLGWTLARR